MTSVTHAKVSAVADTGDTSLVRPSDWNAEHVVSFTEAIILGCSDEVSVVTLGSGKVTFRMPYAFTVTSVRASLTTAQTAGSIITIDVRQNGTSIFSTLVSIDNNEKTSTTATTPAVITTTALTNDSEIIVDVMQIGNGTAVGLKLYLIGTH